MAVEAFTACNRARYWLKSQFLPTHQHLMPSYGAPRRNIATTFGMEKLEWLGYLTVKNFEDTIIHFNRIHERDRRMDRQTDTA